MLHTDLTRFVLRQEDKEEKLKCPAGSKRTDIAAGYRNLTENLVEFSKLNCMPISINLDPLDEGNGIENTLQNKNPCCHCIN